MSGILRLHSGGKAHTHGPHSPQDMNIQPAQGPVGGIVDIGFGEGQIDPRLAAGVGTTALPSTVGTTGLVQGDPWVSTSDWKPPV